MSAALGGEQSLLAPNVKDQDLAMRGVVIAGIACAVGTMSTIEASPHHEEVWKDYTHFETPCERGECPAGGCLFENCPEKVTCKGGLCYFRKCKDALCDGGACVFDGTDKSVCPGGSCKFINMASTLREGYCAGGGCTLEGKPHPKSFAEALSE
ncbi:TPA: hypothetical protein N0F65_006567 [Lagenidium giganteum]|uniref:Uncharacterized protein n=1 Tax=Lagenidium giganteum TaxID=4803 RepID=A0AAV2YQ83_9STRA|nr:TPA: hypothetical protein N0F65_006567 [Lagenidium giganteum]